MVFPDSGSDGPNEMFCFIMLSPHLSTPLPSPVCAEAVMLRWLAGTGVHPHREPLGPPCSPAAFDPERSKCPSRGWARPCGGRQAGPHAASAACRQDSTEVRLFPATSFWGCLSEFISHQAGAGGAWGPLRKKSFNSPAGCDLLLSGPGSPPVHSGRHHPHVTGSS